MDEYIEEFLAADNIYPSMPPVAAGFFFVKTKDGGPCIDYWDLMLSQYAIPTRYHRSQQC